MSSTNRSAGHMAARVGAADYYVTPVNVITAFLTAASELHHQLHGEKYILDPCAGGDSAHDMSYPEALKQCGVDPSRILTMDIRQDSHALLRQDFLTTTDIVVNGTVIDNHDVGLVITNPPFLDAEEIIEHAIKTFPKAIVVMLLRLNFFGGVKRQMFYKRVGMPETVYVHPRRISFRDDKKTDSIEYMHAVWVPNMYSDSTVLKFVS